MNRLMNRLLVVATSLVASVGTAAIAQSGSLPPAPESREQPGRDVPQDRPDRGRPPREGDRDPRGRDTRDGSDRDPRRMAEGRSMRLMDMRDLMSVMPPDSGGRGPMGGRAGRRGGQGGGGGGAEEGGGVSPFATALPMISAPSAGHTAVTTAARLAEPLGLEIMPVSDGIVMIVGPDEAQNRFEEMMGEVRNLYADRVEIEMICATVPSSSAPALGSVLGAGTAVVRTRQTMPRRVEAPIEATRTVTFIETWQPIVSDNSVGYQAMTASVVAGLRCTVIAGAGQEVTPGRNPGGIPIVIRGTISDATIVEKATEVSIAPPAGARTTLTIGLPAVQERSFHAQGFAGEQPTVIAVVSGFAKDELIVIAASVKNADANKN